MWTSLGSGFEHSVERQGKIETEIEIEIDIKIETPLYEGPQVHLQVQWFPRTPRTQARVTVIAIIYYSKRTQSKMGKEKRYMKCSPKATECKLPRVPSPWSATGHAYIPQQQAMATHVKCLTGKFTGGSVPKYFTRDWSCRHPRSPRRKSGSYTGCII